MDGKPLIQAFQDDLNNVVDKYRDEGLTRAEVAGALEFVKLGVWMEHLTAEDDDDSPI